MDGKEQIKVKTPYNIDCNTIVAIFPQRNDRYSNYTITGKYFVEEERFNKEKGCSTTSTLASDLSLKEARGYVQRLRRRGIERLCISLSLRAE